ncbi:hypothetical protein FACS1894199_06560 [Bacteroidia bacterium]|nr:hypothetical protein FACS1894199_06560 [Bacteroidia bacterium]
MKFSREDVLAGAFRVYMKVGYDTTTVSHVQRELRASRGAIYRFFTNMDEVFHAVVEEYISKPFRSLIEQKGTGINLRDLIDSVVEKQESLDDFAAQLGVTREQYLDYLLLVLQAAKHEPDFVAREQQFRNEIIQILEKAMQVSVKENQIRSDIAHKPIAAVFADLLLASMRNADFGINVQENLLAVYDLIKK